MSARKLGRPKDLGKILASQKLIEKAMQTAVEKLKERETTHKVECREVIQSLAESICRPVIELLVRAICENPDDFVDYRPLSMEARERLVCEIVSEVCRRHANGEEPSNSPPNDK